MLKKRPKPQPEPQATDWDLSAVSISALGEELAGRGIEIRPEGLSEAHEARIAILEARLRELIPLAQSLGEAARELPGAVDELKAANTERIEFADRATRAEREASMLAGVVMGDPDRFLHDEGAPDG